jgi:hypothetical protein
LTPGTAISPGICCTAIFGLATHHKLCDIASIDRHRFGLGLHLLGDAEAVKYAEHMNAASGSLVAGERLDRQQRSLERLSRGDIGLGRSRPLGRANGNYHNISNTWLAHGFLNSNPLSLFFRMSNFAQTPTFNGVG